MTEAVVEANGQEHATQEAIPETVFIDDLDNFVRMIVAWHLTQLQRVDHLMQVPEGSTFQVGQDPVTEIVMTPEVLTGFKFGIEMVMMHLGKLPFTVQVEQLPEDEAGDDPQPGH